jgi:hypothetical protein
MRIEPGTITQLFFSPDKLGESATVSPVTGDVSVWDSDKLPVIVCWPLSRYVFVTVTCSVHTNPDAGRPRSGSPKVVAAEVGRRIGLAPFVAPDDFRMRPDVFADWLTIATRQFAGKTKGAGIPPAPMP